MPKCRLSLSFIVADWAKQRGATNKRTKTSSKRTKSEAIKESNRREKKKKRAHCLKEVIRFHQNAVRAHYSNFIDTLFAFIDVVVCRRRRSHHHFRLNYQYNRHMLSATNHMHTLKIIANFFFKEFILLTRKVKKKSNTYAQHLF